MRIFSKASSDLDDFIIAIAKRAAPEVDKILHSILLEELRKGALNEIIRQLVSERINNLLPRISSELTSELIEKWVHDEARQQVADLINTELPSILSESAKIISNTVELEKRKLQEKNDMNLNYLRNQFAGELKQYLEKSFSVVTNTKEKADEKDIERDTISMKLNLLQNRLNSILINNKDLHIELFKPHRMYLEEILSGNNIKLKKVGITIIEIIMNLLEDPNVRRSLSQVRRISGKFDDINIKLKFSEKYPYNDYQQQIKNNKEHYFNYPLLLRSEQICQENMLKTDNDAISTNVTRIILWINEYIFKKDQKENIMVRV